MLTIAQYSQYENWTVAYNCQRQVRLSKQQNINGKIITKTNDNE